MKALKIIGITLSVIITLILLLGFGLYQFYLKPMLKIEPAKNLLQPTGYFDKNMVDSIYKYTRENTRNLSTISIAMIDNGNVHYYGLTRKKETLETLNNSSNLYQIGSISKVFTSALLSNFVVRKEIDINETIDKYISFSLNKDLKLSWKNLSNHTSGLDRLPNGSIVETFKNFDNPYVKYTNDWMKDYLKNKISLDKSKIGKHEYSNLGAAILGNALSLFKGHSYESLLDKSIFKKYNMNNSFVYEANDIHRLVKSYDVEDSLTINWELKSFSPAGGIVSSVQDLSHFVLAQFDSSNRELKYMQNSTLNIDSNRSVGLGWFIILSKQKHKVLFHNGATSNFNSFMAVDLTSQKGIVILSNISFTDTKGNLDKLSFSLLNYVNNSKNNTISKKNN